MESKKNNYKKPDTLVVEIQHHGHLLEGSPQHPGAGAREQNSNWSSEDWFVKKYEETIDYAAAEHDGAQWKSRVRLTPESKRLCPPWAK